MIFIKDTILETDNSWQSKISEIKNNFDSLKQTRNKIFYDNIFINLNEIENLIIDRKSFTTETLLKEIVKKTGMFIDDVIDILLKIDNLPKDDNIKLTLLKEKIYVTLNYEEYSNKKKLKELSALKDHLSSIKAPSNTIYEITEKKRSHKEEVDNLNKELGEIKIFFNDKDKEIKKIIKEIGIFMDLLKIENIKSAI